MKKVVYALKAKYYSYICLTVYRDRLAEWNLTILWSYKLLNYT